MKAKVQKLDIPKGKRVVCVSDIHGNLNTFRAVLEKVRFTDEDILIILGDLCTRGPQCEETLRYIMELCERPNVHALRGNGDGRAEFLTPADFAWFDRLPHIIESDEYVFVHSGLASDDTDDQDAWACMKTDAFMDGGLGFKKYVVVGHWPTINYCHRVPCCAPIIDEDSKIISIDGGMSVKAEGQLNAFVIEDGAFSFEWADDLPVMEVKRAQEERRGALNITWCDRWIEVIEDGDDLCLCRHEATGRLISLPKSRLWRDEDGTLCCTSLATDHHIAVEVGDEVRVVRQIGGVAYVKKNSVGGWIEL